MVLEMKSGYVAELVRESWAMEPKALESFLARVAECSAPVFSREDGLAELLAGTEFEAEAGDKPKAFFFSPAPHRSRVERKDGVATIPISGVLLKRVPMILRFLGFDATSYSDIQEDIAEALADDQVREIRLRVESPGGQVAGVDGAGEAIFRARSRKRVTAQVDDMAASAAYWLASQAQTISAGPNDLVGSIGVYSVYVDSSKAAEKKGLDVHVIASGPHKAMGVPGAPITDAQISAMREVIDGIAENFVSAVARGRGTRPRSEVRQWATGRLWIASEAKSLGLIDSVSTSDDSSPSGSRAAVASSDTQKGEEGMNDKTPTQMADQSAQASEDARKAERQRHQDLVAAFPGEADFVSEQYGKGNSVSQAKAEYADVLKERNAKLEKENKTLAAKAAASPAKPAGAEPVSSEHEPAADQGDFMGRARELAAERGWPVRQAISHLSKVDRPAYEKYLEQCRARGPEIQKRMNAAGMK